MTAPFPSGARAVHARRPDASPTPGSRTHPGRACPRRPCPRRPVRSGQGEARRCLRDCRQASRAKTCLPCRASACHATLHWPAVPRLAIPSICDGHLHCSTAATERHHWPLRRRMTSQVAPMSAEVVTFGVGQVSSRRGRCRLAGGKNEARAGLSVRRTLTPR